MRIGFFVITVFVTLAGCGARDQLLVGGPSMGGQGGDGAGGTGGMGGGGAGGTAGGGMGGGGTGGAPPIVPIVEQLSLGAAHTCVLGQDGTVWCWGNNASGQLGGATPEGQSLVPVRVDDLGLVTRLAAGYDHTCAIVAPEAGPQVVCWGGNGLGQSTAYPTDDPVGVTPVPGTEGATELAAGQYHTCAKVDAQTICWGSNESGQLGDGSVGGTTMGLPTLVQAGNDLSGLTLGAHHSCGSTGMGPVCWGENIDGELGLPPPAGSAVPVLVPSGAGFLSSKGHFTCGLEGAPDPAGPVCWGDNDSGQLALGMKSPNEGPSYGSPVSGPEALAVAITHACSLTVFGEVYCWGSNYNGQLGISGADSYVPQKVPSLADVTRIAAGTLHTCVAKAEAGAVYCWGTNDYGQLGIGTTNSSSIPVKVSWGD